MTLVERVSSKLYLTDFSLGQVLGSCVRAVEHAAVAGRMRFSALSRVKLHHQMSNAWMGTREVNRFLAELHEETCEARAGVSVRSAECEVLKKGKKWPCPQALSLV